MGRARFNLNIGSADASGVFIDAMKAFQSAGFNAGANPSHLDGYGYPNTNLPANFGGAVLLPSGMADNNTEWTLKNTGSRTLRLVINAFVTKTGASGSAVTSGGNNSSMTVTFAGVGAVTFKFNNYSGSSFSLFFPSGFANAGGTGGLSLVRTSDDAALTAGAVFTPEYLAIMSALKPSSIRPMGWVNMGAANLNNNVKWAYRTTPLSLGWLVNQFPPGAFGGTVSGIDTYTVGAAPDSPADWTAREVILVFFPAGSSNTITTPTLKIGSRASAKIILSQDGEALPVGKISANAFGTLIYDELLDALIYTSDGLTSCVPIEVQARLANDLNCDLWAVCPYLCEDDYITQWASAVLSSLSASLAFYPEFSNELWNGSFPQYHWITQRGIALNIPNTGNNRCTHAYASLRTIQMIQLVNAVWVGQASRVRGVLAVQAYGSGSEYDTYRLSGADLDTSKGYTRYNSYVGASYNVAPNRPIDFAKVISPADYYSGANIINGDGNYNSSSASFLQALANQYDDYITNGNVSSLNTALASIDNDIRAGTRNSSLGSFTLAYLKANIYPTWNALAVTYGKDVENYEGGLEAIMPSVATLTAYGVTIGGSASTASLRLNALLDAYKKSPKYMGKLVKDHVDDFMSFSKSRAFSNLQLTGPSQWSLLSGNVLSQPYQSYFATQSYMNAKRRWSMKT